MTIFQKETTLQALATREIELAGRKRAALETVSRAETSAGIAIAEGGEIDEHIAPALKARSEVNALDFAISTLRGRRPAVITDANIKAARSIRDDAAKKQRQLEQLDQKCEKLLAQLGELQAIPFTARILEAMPVSDLGPLSGCYTTRSETLTSEIAILIARAASLESAPLPNAGYIELDDVKDDGEVLLAILSHPSAGPSAESVMRFLARCAKNPSVPDHDFGVRPRRVRIDWRDGEITDGYVHCRDLDVTAQPVKGTHAPYVMPSDRDCGLFRPAA